MKSTKAQIDHLLTRSVTNIIPGKKELEKLLSSGRKLNIYLGIDPTATSLHLGNAVPLRKIQEFADLGHNVNFLIGDFTALIGDTSDKDSERPILTRDEINNNFQTYKKQAEKFVDFSKVKVVKNSSWLSKLNFEDIVKLAQNFSVGDFVSRELIKKRLESGKRVRLDEVLYPVMQGYDSYHMDTDVQIGGADQTFNMQAGRTLQKNLRDKQSFVLVTGYLEGTDGRKMSKSWGNAIWIEDDPKDIFGKVMSINDDLIPSYFQHATNLPADKVENQIQKLKDKGNPLNIKKLLAFQIVKEIHGKKFASQAQQYFEKTFQKGEPVYKKEVGFKKNIVDTISQMDISKSEAKRLIAQGAVDINGKTVRDPAYKLKGGENLRIGKKIYVKVKAYVKSK